MPDNTHGNLPTDFDQIIADVRDQAERIELPAGPRSDVIPGYELIREIHRGGQGVVYLAYQHATHRDVAIKILREGPFAGGAERARFEREIQILAALQHPHIVAIHDSGNAGGSFYFVMDYIAGLPLDEWADQQRSGWAVATSGLTGSSGLSGKGAGGRKRVRQALFLSAFIKICDALNVAHQRGVIHRDLKPTNIRVAENDEPFVLDFGLAKMTSNGIGETDSRMLTATGQFLGTLPWASPEQVEGTTYHADIRTDIYALGLMLYRSLTGRMPFSLDSSVAEMIRVITQVEPSRPRSWVKDLDEDLETIVLKCLHKDPDRRYQTAAAVAEDLQRYLRYEPIGARRESSWYLLRMFARRHRIAVGVTCGLAVLLVGASILLTYLYVRAKSSERLALHRADETRRVAEFQASQLAGIDTALMGIRLRAELVARARQSNPQSSAAGTDDASLTTSLEQSLSAVNFTDLALHSLDENIFQRALEAIDQQFQDQPQIRAALLQTVANSLRSLGLLDRAVAPQSKAVQLFREELGDDHPDTLASLHNMGLLLYGRGEREQALAELRQVLQTRQRVLGKDHPDSLTSMNALGDLLQSMDRLDEALQYHRDTLAACRRVLGAEHTLTLGSLANLGALNFQRGDFKAARKYYREALDSMRRVLGSEHPETLTVMNNMGMMLRTQGEWDEAITLFREVLSARRKTLGDKHPGTLNSIDNLAGTLTLRGHVDEAVALRKEALAGYLASLGKEHPNTLSSMNGMGHVLMSLGKFGEAAPYLDESLKLHRRILGDAHTDTVITITYQGRLLSQSGRFAEALPFSREALATNRRILGPDHPNTLSSLADLGSVLNSLNQIAEAESCLRESLAANQRVFGDKHPTTLAVMVKLGGVCVKQAKTDEALTLYQAAREGFREKFGDLHPNTLATIMSIGSALREQKQWDEALPYYVEGLEGYRRALGNEHPFTLRSINLMGELALVRNQLDDAFTHFRESSSTSERVLGTEHPETVRSRINMGVVLTRQEKFTAAESHLLQAATVSEKLPPQHNLQVRLTKEIVKLYEAWDAAEPDGGHAAQVAKFRAKAEALKGK